MSRALSDKEIGRYRVLFTQPGMRYCQAEALVRAMMKDSSFSKKSSAEQEYVTG